MRAVRATSSKPLPSPPVTVRQAAVLNQSRRAPPPPQLENEGKNITAGTNFGADVTRQRLKL